jgi:hypothetical protein
MARAPDNAGRPWPRFMRAATAAAYCDEVSVEAFRRKVGTVYPLPVTRRGSRQKWDRLELDMAGAAGASETPTIIDAASVL